MRPASRPIFGESLQDSRVVALATDLVTLDSSELSNDVAVDTVPMIINDVLTPVINEGDKATLSGQLVDPDKGDELSLVVNWGDGSPVQTYHPKLNPFAFKHRYDDDGTYNVQFTWLDDHGGSNTRTRQVVVHNVAPKLRHVDLHPDHSHVHQKVVLTGRVVEPGTDHLTLTVDWGDGTVDTISGDDLRNFRVKHRYRHAGHFTIQLTVTDDDAGMDSKTLLVDVG